MTLVLVYHELSDDGSPLALSPELFSEHLAVLSSLAANVVTTSEMADLVRNDGLHEPTVALTFDDGFARAVREARPRLASAGMRATFFCVADHVGGRSDWPSRLPTAPVAPLAGSDELAALAQDGHEIGSHGWSHVPLDGYADLVREVVESRSALESMVGCEVSSFAYPYGSSPSAEARGLVEETYACAFGTAVGRIGAGASLYDLPRVDAHYVRDPRLLRRVVRGSLQAYLEARRFGSRARRALRKDYVSGAAR